MPYFLAVSTLILLQPPPPFPDGLFTSFPVTRKLSEAVVPFLGRVRGGSQQNHGQVWVCLLLAATTALACLSSGGSRLLYTF